MLDHTYDNENCPVILAIRRTDSAQRSIYLVTAIYLDYLTTIRCASLVYLQNIYVIRK